MSAKVVVITGGSRGLGRNTALHVARSGWDVVLTYLSNEAQAHEAAGEIQALGRKAVALRLDVSQSKTFSDFADRLKSALKATWGRETFDALVNNAGTGIHVPFKDTTEEQFDQMVNVHLKATYFLTQKLLPLIADGGRIVNLSSGLARFSLPGYSAYAAMKGGIEVLTRYLAQELGPRRIAVNTVAPGAIETDFGGGMVRDNKNVNSLIASQTALGRVGLPDDIGPAIASLLSENLRWVNAQRLEISGGIHL
jgi:NAD(P)-dependent dehydrogenase (short-subunit alcohol dehydrogenase family)